MDTPIGNLRIQVQDGALIAIHFEEDPAVVPDPRSKEDLALHQEVQRQLREYFAGTRTRFELPLAPAGTPFQKQAWQTLCEIPYGETWSYKEQAGAMGNIKAVRAVGAANGKNPIPVIIPCHRVIGSGGKLVGYAGGLEIKKALLGLEGQATRDDDDDGSR